VYRGDPLTGRDRVLFPGERPPGSRPLVKAVTVGTVLQGGMVAAGHFLPGLLEANLYPIIGTLIALLTGLTYGFSSHGNTLFGSAARGALAAGLAAGLAIGAAYLLRQVPLNRIGIAAMTAAIAGLIGGLLGKLRTGLRE
jgi:hypothetical protein